MIRREISGNPYYLLRPDCRLKRISDIEFAVSVNENREIIEIGKNAGDVLEYILPMLNRRHSIDEIFHQINKDGKKTNFSKPNIKKIIRNLFTWGLISELNCPSKSIQLNYFSAFSSYPMKLQKKLGSVFMGIVGGKFIASPLIHSLCLSGIQRIRLIGSHIVESDEASLYRIRRAQGMNWHKALSKDLLLLQPSKKINLEYVDRPLESIFDEPDSLKGLDVLLLLIPPGDKNFVFRINKACLKMKTKLLLGILNFSSAAIGPFVLPFQSSCLACMGSRYKESSYVNSNVTSSDFELEDDLVELNKNENSHANFIPFVMSYAHLIAGYACLHTLGLSNLLIDHQIKIDYKTGQIQKYFILKSPRCSSCGHLNSTEVLGND